ncbi:MAG: FecR domain-containing protein [Bacteroidales bacterium]|nr:FecR domain-containing protein [Bacteroidales bacterium]
MELQTSKLSELEAQFFSGTEISYTLSQDEAWENIQARILNRKKGHKKIALVRVLRWTAAASIALFIGLGIWAGYYSHHIINQGTEQLSYTFPDGSLVMLNSSSQFSYHPYWWRFSRAVTLQGEGYFVVEKGTTFSVISGNSKTQVLGTRFNVLARAQVYEVDCFAGKVQVSHQEGNPVILTSHEKAVLTPNGSFIKLQKEIQQSEPNWLKSTFSFQSTPLMQVIQEIERQYQVSISVDKIGNHRYSGYFEKKSTVEETLSIICKPFHLTFIKLNDHEFLLTQETPE